MYYIKHIFFAEVFIFSESWALVQTTAQALQFYEAWALLHLCKEKQQQKKPTHVHIQMYIHIHHDVYTSYTWETLNSQAVSPMPRRWPWH